MNRLVVAMDICLRIEAFNERLDATIGWIAELVYIKDIERLMLECSAQYLIEVRTIEPWTKPVCGHIGCLGSMVFARVDHGKGLRKLIAESRQQPVLVVINCRILDLACLDEIADALDDKIGRQTVQV